MLFPFPLFFLKILILTERRRRSLRHFGFNRLLAEQEASPLSLLKNKLLCEYFDYCTK